MMQGDHVTPPETYSTPELVRTMQRIEAMATEIRTELRAQRAEFVPREVWEEAWRGLSEWKSTISKDVVDLEAGTARDKRDLEEKITAERNARTAGNRAALAVAIPALVGVLGMLVAIWIG